MAEAAADRPRTLPLPSPTSEDKMRRTSAEEGVDVVSSDNQPLFQSKTIMTPNIIHRHEALAAAAALMEDDEEEWDDPFAPDIKDDDGFVPHGENNAYSSDSNGGQQLGGGSSDHLQSIMAGDNNDKVEDVGQDGSNAANEKVSAATTTSKSTASGITSTATATTRPTSSSNNNAAAAGSNEKEDVKEARAEIMTIQDSACCEEKGESSVDPPLDHDGDIFWCDGDGFPSIDANNIPQSSAGRTSCNESNVDASSGGVVGDIAKEGNENGQHASAASIAKASDIMADEGDGILETTNEDDVCSSDYFATSTNISDVIPASSPTNTIPAPASSPSSEKRRERRKLRQRGDDTLEMCSPHHVQDDDDDDHDDDDHDDDDHDDDDHDDDDNSITTKNSKESLLSTCDKRRERRKLRKRGGERQQQQHNNLFVNLDDDDDDDDDSITTYNTKETHATTSTTVSCSLDKRRGRRKLRRGEQQHQVEESAEEAVTTDDAAGGDNSVQGTSNISQGEDDSSLPLACNTSEKRRERRKLRRGGHAAADGDTKNEEAVQGDNGDDDVTSLASDNHTKEETHASASSTAITVNSCEKRRERRKLRRGATSDTQQNEQQNDDVGESTNDDDPPLAGSPPVAPSAPPAAAATSPALVRRRKIANGVATGKVPIPKAFHAKNNASANDTKKSLLASLSVGGTAAAKIDKVDKAAAMMEEDDANVDIRSPPKTPTSLHKIPPPVMLSPSTPTSGGASPSSSSQRLIVTPANEVEMKLVEESRSNDHLLEGEQLHPSLLEGALLSLPVLQTPSSVERPSLLLPSSNSSAETTNKPSPEKKKHEARRNRRHLRNRPVTNKERVEMALRNNGATVQMEEEDMMEKEEVLLLLVHEEEEDVGDDSIATQHQSNTSPKKQCDKSYGFVSDTVKSSLVNALKREERARKNAAASAANATTANDCSTPNCATPTAARSHSPTSSIVSSALLLNSRVIIDENVSAQIAEALDKARRAKFDRENSTNSNNAREGEEEDAPSPLKMEEASQEIGLDNVMMDSGGLDVGNNEQDPNNLFPREDSFLEMSLEQHQTCESATANDNDAAWDANAASNQNAIMETSKAHNKASSSEVDGRPLLHLETIISSDNQDGIRASGLEVDKVDESYYANLSKQKERMAMYTNSEGFGVGEDSSVDNDDEGRDSRCNSEDEEEDAGVEVSDNRVLFDYEDMNNMIDDDDDDDENVGNDEEVEALDTFQPIEPGSEVPTFSPTGNMTTMNATTSQRAMRWNSNPDAISDVMDDDESDFFNDTHSRATTTDGSSVFGLRFAGSSTVCSNNSGIPTPPQSPAFELVDSDVTPKIGTKGSASASDCKKSSVTEENIKSSSSTSPVKLFKIPPPPPEKLRMWEESKGGIISKSLTTNVSKSQTSEGISSPEDDNRTTTLPQDAYDQLLSAHQIAKASSPDVLKSRPRSNDDSLNYKILLPKSPKPNKKHPHSLVEELDLASHKRMAEKIVLASSKAARKFEEEYSRDHSEEENGPKTPILNDATTSENSRFFCAGDVTPIISGTSQSNNNTSSGNSPCSTEPKSLQLPNVGELVRGAFSPWKIPDRAEDESSISSAANPRSSMSLYDSELYANATAAAVKSIRGLTHDNGDENSQRCVGGSSNNSEGGNMQDNDNSSTLNESFEVSLEETDNKGEAAVGSLTSVLHWLFKEVLPTSNHSQVATAFAAFDIHTSTTVQSDRVLAIAKDDESFNIICKYVAANVMRQYGSGNENVVDSEKNETTTDDAGVPFQIIGNDGSCDEEDAISVSTYMTTSSISESKQSTFAQKAALRIFKARERVRNIDPFEIPLTTASDDGCSVVRPNADVLAANFVGFLQQISNLTDIPSPFPGGINPFLQSVVHNLTSSKKKTDDNNFHKRERTKSMQDLVFPNENRVVLIFSFLAKSCKGVSGVAGGGDAKHHVVLSVIEEDTNDGNKKKDATAATPLVSMNTLGADNAAAASQQQPCLPSDSQARGGCTTVRKSNKRNKTTPHNKTSNKPKSSSNPTVNLNYIVPQDSPSPFETSVWNQPSIVLSVLSFLGNPVAVCVMKRLNVFCNRVVCENEHVLMRDAVRLGGMSKYVRPSFWLWVTERCRPEDPIPLIPSRRGFEPQTNNASSKPAPTTPKNTGRDFFKLKDIGAKGKWQHIIERDVTRAFGNMPPHKTGARYRQDSIVRALVSFGKEEIMRNSRSYQAMDKLPEESEAKHFKLSSRLDRRDDSSNGGSSGSLTPTDTVSDWGGISPVGSLVSEDPSIVGNNMEEPMRVVSYENGELLDTNPKTLKLNSSRHTSRSTDVSDPVLSGNALTSEMKVDLQNKLRSILHALAARHEAVGYCQGMDYVVAHLLRVLQDTILLRVVQRSMPVGQTQTTQDNENTTEVEDWRTISSDELRSRMSAINTQSCVVEEVVFGVMDTFFSTYNLQHMYWPELRCLKTHCRVFESLIKQKLPVLADHFQHYDLNVGIFALGWFQTLFLYLPSMPSATVCHIWDIYLVERSFKIFFRVGTAILFLSQPTLLNHDGEGMMTYLNTFPDATLLRRDILIPCALQIKITNRMLAEIEMEVAKFNQSPDHNNEYFPTI